MIDKHPIDDLFRAGLAQAEVAPPAAIWEGIVAQQSWSNRLLKSLRKYWWVPLLFLVFTGAGIGAVVNSSAGNAHNRDSSSLNSTNLPQGLLASSKPLTQEQSVTTNSTNQATSALGINSETQSAVITEPRNSDYTGKETNASGKASPRTDDEADSKNPHSGKPILAENTAQGASEDEKHEEPQAPLLSEGEQVNADDKSSTKHLLAITKLDQTSKRNNSIAEAAGVRRSSAFIDATAEMMEIRSSSINRDNIQRSGARGKGKINNSAGSIPPGDWWVGGSVGFSKLNTNYAGTPPALSESLNTGESGKHEISFDLLGGRSWRNGFFVSAGLGSGSWTSKSDFSETKSYALYSDSITYVGFDSLTQAPIYDTVSHYLGQQDSTTGFSATNRYSLIRVPLTAGWVKDIGRFELGVQGGLIFEFDAGRKGYSLVAGNGTADSLLVSDFAVVELDNAQLNPRYGLGISGTAGAIIGYKLNEFMSVWVSPEYTTRLATLSKDNIQLNAERFGVRFGIRYVLPY